MSYNRALCHHYKKGARIFLADDDPVFRGQLHDWLESEYAPTRHRIPLEARSVSDALAFIPEQLKVQDINVALIDDMFNRKSEGYRIVEAITQSGLAIAMLSCSTEPVRYLEAHVGKDLIRIEAALNQMFPPRRRKR